MVSIKTTSSDAPAGEGARCHRFFSERCCSIGPVQKGKRHKRSNKIHSRERRLKRSSPNGTAAGLENRRNWNPDDLTWRLQVRLPHRAQPFRTGRLPGGGGQELRPRACLTQSSASLRRARYKTAVLPTSFRYTKGLLQRVAVVLTRSESVSAPGGPHWLQVELLPEDPVPVPTCLPWFPMWSRTGELALSLRSSV